MGTFPFVSAHQRVALCAMCRQFTGGCSGATPVALPSRVPVAAGDRPVASGLQPRLHIQSCHACEDCEPSPSPGAQGALGPHQRRASRVPRQPAAPSWAARAAPRPLRLTVVSVSMEKKQGASAEPGRRRRRQEAKQTGPRGRGAVGGAGAALRFLAGRRGEVSGYGAPVRPAPDLQREWDLSGWCGGAGVRALAGGLLLGDLPEGASGSHTGTLVLLVRRAAGRGWLAA